VKRVRAVPTLLTLANLLSGFGSITMSIRAIDENGSIYLEMAVWLVGLAMVFDLLDGRVARLTGLTSRFGAELDSLADVVSFGLAPAVLSMVLLKMHLDPENTGRPGHLVLQRFCWFMLALYAAAAAVRLARYNVESINAESGGVTAKSKGSEYFTGLPSPAAAGMAVSPVLLHLWLQGLGDDTLSHETKAILARIFAVGLPGLMLVLAWLMVSRVRYLHLGNWLSARRQKLIPVMLLVALLALAAAFRHRVPFVAVGVYVIGGLVWDLGRRMTNARARRKLLGSGAGGASSDGPSQPSGS
jgi:CDP-diacylglycerol--serine O-phosphatidyltransferase